MRRRPAGLRSTPVRSTNTRCPASA
jgi:hypothetical protein